jgi:serine/threonine protein kinase
MSPEQALGLAEVIDERSDIYSLGAILFEILTGQRLSSEHNLVSLQALHSEEIGASPDVDLALSLPVDLVEICTRAMAADKADRFNDARELAAAIQQVQTGAEIVLEQLAEAVHIAYVEERQAQGWRYGPVRDDVRKENPTLIPYSDLSEEEKDMDRVTARQTIFALRRLGFIVARDRKPFPL